MNRPPAQRHPRHHHRRDRAHLQEHESALHVAPGARSQAVDRRQPEQHRRRDRDGRVSDLIPEVASRYLGARADRQLFEVWKFTRQARSVKRGYVLRIQVPASFRLHWSGDEWQTVKDTPSSTTTLGVDFVDIPILASQRPPIRFTFFWTTSD